MKITVEYDEHGTIKAVATRRGQSSKEMGTTLQPQPGHKVAEVEVPEIKDEQNHENIIKITRNFRVEEHQGQHRLVSK